MSWLRIDDGFLENPKITGLSDRAFRLHMAGLCYCARNLTDGRLDPVATRVILALVSAKKQHVSELEQARLWKRSEPDWVVKDYLEYNPDAETAKAVRETRKAAGKLGAAKRWGAEPMAQAMAPAMANAMANGDSKSHGKSVMPRPVPSPKASNPVTATKDVTAEPDDGHGHGDYETVNKLLAQAALEDMPE